GHPGLRGDIGNGGGVIASPGEAGQRGRDDLVAPRRPRRLSDLGHAGRPVPASPPVVVVGGGGTAANRRSRPGGTRSAARTAGTGPRRRMPGAPSGRRHLTAWADPR